jgi:hypothetical protein
MSAAKRRASPVASRSGEGRLTQSIAAVQGWRPEPVLMPLKRPSRVRRPITFGGLPKYAAQDPPVADADLVLWATIGFHHVLRLKD